MVTPTRSPRRAWTVHRRGVILVLAIACLPSCARPVAPTLQAPAPSGLPLIREVLGYVRASYLDPRRARPRELLVGAMKAIARAVGSERIAQEGLAVETREPTATRRLLTGRVDDDAALLAALERAITRLGTRAGHRVPPGKLERIAARGMVRHLDPHSILLHLPERRERRLRLAHRYGGIGVSMAVQGRALRVLTSFPGTPAARAGLRGGDRILSIDGAPTRGMKLLEATLRIRGPSGTPVALRVERPGCAARLRRIPRAAAAVPSVTSSLHAGGVGYLRVRSIRLETGRDLRDHLRRLRRQNRRELRGLLLDLRDNPGGSYRAAVSVVDLFLRSGVIVSARGFGSGIRVEERARDDGSEPAGPLLVLVNRRTASAAEIVAGSLRHHRRALILGERTRGKGTVQASYDLEDGSMLTLTVAEYRLPGGARVEGRGIVPDVTVAKLATGAGSGRLAEAIRVATSDRRIAPRPAERGPGEAGLLAELRKLQPHLETMNTESGKGGVSCD